MVRTEPSELRRMFTIRTSSPDFASKYSSSVDVVLGLDPRTTTTSVLPIRSFPLTLVRSRPAKAWSPRHARPIRPKIAAGSSIKTLPPYQVCLPSDPALCSPDSSLNLPPSAWRTTSGVDSTLCVASFGAVILPLRVSIVGILPIAATCLAKRSSTFGGFSMRSWRRLTPSGIGVPAGCSLPPWHELQVISFRPPKCFVLMSRCMSTIARAVSFVRVSAE